MLQKLKQMNKTKRYMVIIGLVCMIAGTTHEVLADNGSPTISAVEGGLIFAAFMVGGVEWSTSGFASALRAHQKIIKAGQTDPTWKGFEGKKLKDDMYIGMFLGVIAFLTSSIANLHITDAGSFLVVVQFAYGTIGATDKFIVGGGLGQ